MYAASGSMLGIELNSADLAKKVAKEMLARKIVINRTHETTLRFLPPFIIERKHVDQVVQALDSILSSCKQTGDAGSVSAARSFRAYRGRLERPSPGAPKRQ